ncbi:MAG: hypothetical protein E7562_06885 [Ruminococcaceae bacterium]|nr:hypothetical protein [Oscillospiraceae bacterium]
MKIVVCIRQGRNGEINPFDACSYEAALSVPNAEITLLSMGPASVEEFLLGLTRLGAKRAILLCDKAFAGADTLATAYALSCAIKKLSPDYVFCGRQTLEGDTAQTGPMLSVKLGSSLITNVMAIKSCDDDKIVCETRTEGEAVSNVPALITVERINTLRLPRLRSKLGTVEVWDAACIDADISKCGLTGSPTRVIKTYENQSGHRKCEFLSPDKLRFAVEQGLLKNAERTAPKGVAQNKLSKVYIVGEAPRGFAETVSDDITVLPLDTPENLAQIIKKEQPKAVLWGSDPLSKRLSAQVASMLNLGLCADCTSLETDGEQLFMIRPALSGSIIAKIKSVTFPAMATVRTAQEGIPDVFIAAGYGVKDNVEAVEKLAESFNGAVAATRKMVDQGILPYEYQVGLTGKVVSPPVYIAVGVSGAVHHIVGMDKAGTVIAVNPDKDAPIFDYADYGIVCAFEELKFQ